MSIVAIKGVHPKWSMRSLNAAILNAGKFLRGKVEILNFDKVRGDSKTAYLRVSEKLDPLRVVAMLNRNNIRGNPKLVAFIPSHVPDLPLAYTGKPKSTKRLLSYGQSKEWILESTHRELLGELQRKYRSLYDLSKNTEHKLLDEIAETLLQRLKQVMETDSTYNNCYTLSKAYRTAHPHFADFQLILSTLHRIEDAAGSPRTQLQENELLASTEPYDAFAEVHKMCSVYLNKIVAKVRAHVRGLRADADARPPQAQRRRVRSELDNLSPYYATILKQIMASVFSRKASATCYHKMRIYGEPDLPRREELTPFLKRGRPISLFRSNRIYNMFWYKVPLAHFEDVMKLDGMDIGGCKLIMRPGKTLEYRVKPELLAKMALASDDDTTQEINFDVGEDWGADIEI